MNLHINIRLQKPGANGDIKTLEGGFDVNALTLSDPGDLNLPYIINTVHGLVENFNRRGSNWQVDRILNCTLTFVPYRPTQGMQYFETP